MPATKLNEAEQFSALDGLAVVFLPVVAATNGIPTRAEINAGTDLTTELAEMYEGFEVTPGNIELGGLRRFPGSIPGKVEVENGSMRFFADRGSDDVREVLPDGTTGFIAFMDGGDVPTSLMDVWPVRVNKISKMRSDDAATMLRVDFTHPRLPKEDVVIPANA
jgi:hypothetical protein